MPKRNFNSGLESEGPHRQGDKGGKGGTQNKAGSSASGPGKSRPDQIGPYSPRDDDKRPRTPTVRRKASPTGKGSGNR